MIYLDRRNFKAKKLLDKGLNLGLGTYKVENITLFNSLTNTCQKCQISNNFAK